MISYSSRVASRELPEGAHRVKVITVLPVSGHHTFRYECQTCGKTGDAWHKPQTAEKAGIKHIIDNMVKPLPYVVENEFPYYLVARPTADPIK